MCIIIQSIAPMASSKQQHSSPSSSPAKGRGQQHRPQRFPVVDDMVALDNLYKSMNSKLEAVEVQAAEYRLNPLTAEVLTKKPTQVTSSRKVTKQEFEEAQKFLGACFPIQDLDMPPPEKYEVPMTASQEYGWCSQPLVRKIWIHPFSLSSCVLPPIQVKPKKLFNYSRESCEITQFAAAYFECVKTTPYSKRGFVPRYKLKQQQAEASAATVPDKASVPPPVSSNQTAALPAPP
ncbi:uncharacterized protein LOC9636815 isoform X1 [Selaginella moellendorffii]|uniref:uncharacterized protein LOC9636815 isoform X1 n=1 Tax=Selaginella moellendorffii TaxID=88036 RepID=UPI000D1C6B0F|nr:uncharacterized protein LOC9636815 isoform X1 [Selaginella moellendorffii]|eukprot:XP_024533470.1 uncharacterized protein LOC9636815 isoform X1 [Selaginella moellendorffii]